MCCVCETFIHLFSAIICAWQFQINKKVLDAVVKFVCGVIAELSSNHKYAKSLQLNVDLQSDFCLLWLQGRGNMDSGLSPQDKKDLDKFIKFFALKVSSQWWSCFQRVM